jgi:hypothetical protein
MPADDHNGESFEDMVRSIARELGRSVERAVDNVDMDDLANTVGVDPDTAKDWIGNAGIWLRTHAEMFGDEFAARAGAFSDEFTARGGTPPRRETVDDPLTGAGPHPLDLPTEEQGRALAALASGRWMVEPGTDLLAARGDGPGPSDALGLVRELRVRDWLGADGEITIVGRHALTRWLDSTAPR